MSPPSALADALRAAGVPIVVPGDEAYETELLKSCTTRPDALWKPLVIARPKRVEQVSAAVKAGAAAGVKVVARSGGHSSAAISLGGRDGHLVIDMAQLNDITVDAANQLAVIGAGSRLGPVHLALDAFGQAISGGLCPGVGIGGMLGHGGAQFAHRAHGFAMDQITAYDVVLADGTIAHVTKTSDPDLFWALNGFASSYAIVCHYHISTWQPPPLCQAFDYRWSTDTATATSIFSALQDWTNDADAVPGFARLAFMHLTPAEPLSGDHLEFSIQGNYLGDRTSFDKRIKSFLAQLPAPASKSVDTHSWIDLVDTHKWGMSKGEGLDCKNYRTRHPIYERTLLLTHDLSEAAIRDLLGYLAHYSPDAAARSEIGIVAIELLGGTDSVLNRVSTDTSSFPRRKDIKGLVWPVAIHRDVHASVDISPRHRAYTDDLHAIVLKHADDPGAYANVPESGGADVQRRYFGDSLPKLSQLKKRYDPHDTFWTPTTVPLPA